MILAGEGVTLACHIMVLHVDTLSHIGFVRALYLKSNFEIKKVKV